MKSHIGKPLCAVAFSFCFITVAAPGASVTFKDGTSFVVGANTVINYAGTEDSVRNSTPGLQNINYGSWIDWPIGFSSGGLRNDGLIRFDVTAMAGQYSAINSVTLRMYKYINGESGVFNNISDRYVDVHALTGTDVNWVEGTGPGPGGHVQPGEVTWSDPRYLVPPTWTSPLPGALAADNVVVGAANGTYVNFALDPNLINLSSLINNWSAQPSNGGLRVQFDGLPNTWSREFIFGSSENPTGVEGVPELVIDYTPIPEPAAFLPLLMSAGWLAGRKRGRRTGQIHVREQASLVK